MNYTVPYSPISMSHCVNRQFQRLNTSVFLEEDKSYNIKYVFILKSLKAGINWHDFICFECSELLNRIEKRLH